MGKLFFLIMVIALLVGCSMGENKNSCPVVDKSLVPAVVKTGFQGRYPADSVITWFKKGNIGYCAYFIQPVNHRKLAEFSPAGVLVSEEPVIDKDGNFKDSIGQSALKGGSVCECIIPQ